MGSYGSLHFFLDNKNETIQKIIIEYSNPHSILNSDEDHNGYGKPRMIIGKEYISVYDGSFAVYGDLYSEAFLLSSIANMPILGVTETNGDMVGMFAVFQGKIVTEALYYDGEWIKSIDIPLLVETLHLPHYIQEIELLFSAEDVDEFIERFHTLTGIPFALRYFETDNLFCYLELQETTEFIDIYAKKRAF